MSTAYEQSGRTRQKQRTRNDLIAAARELITQGGSAPTVEEAAAAASISRTTAYRYFRSQAELLAAAHPEVELTSLLPAGSGDDPETRLLAVVGAFIEMLLKFEPQQRTMLRLSLEPSSQPDQLPLRQGRGIGWFEDALAPARDRLSEAAVHRLAIAVRSAVGIEALVWLVDVAGLSRDDAADVMLSSARAIVRAALSEGDDA
ncbi:TetR/AcrR family transcriptional regulator [Kribbella sindirgiensis]|uniref:TetR/AcrR family transcriptional regulator n=1 Tax=Kribbella sindirgiensis TaxID=1124744 RepID=A0A4R0IPP6_9ACTN|nr:TetR/AcrR family transcriptional regulator [Kribbella sindirgiensis]TCC30635.1 TetR/AcrR family transcriptional regulator [Kribbella sindirgiensis]